jgi:ubiquinone/menaquinone biosynthesis C-methylase UbiE
MTDMQAHWQHIYQTKTPDNVSWYQEHPALSLDLIVKTGITPTARIIDVGAGASTLADHLLAAGYQDITLLDISADALRVAQERLGAQAAALHWLVGDVTEVEFEAAIYDVWHDRAVFHFLTDSTQRARYVAQVRRAVKAGGHVIVATFAADGPTQCSGLDVMRYDAAGLHGAFGAGFALLESAHETHVTPWSSEQRFVYCYCRIGK